MKQSKVQDYKQQGYYMMRRFKNHKVADTSMGFFGFFSSPMLRLWFLCLHSSCQGLHETCVQQRCLSTGCLWCFWEGSWQSLDLNISPDQWLSELPPQVTYGLLWTAGALLRLAELLLQAQTEEPPQPQLGCQHE